MVNRKKKKEKVGWAGMPTKINDNAKSLKIEIND